MHTYRQNDDAKWEVGYYIMVPANYGGFAISKWVAVDLYEGNLSKQQAETAVNYLNGGSR